MSKKIDISGIFSLNTNITRDLHSSNIMIEEKNVSKIITGIFNYIIKCNEREIYGFRISISDDTINIEKDNNKNIIDINDFNNNLAEFIFIRQDLLDTCFNIVLTNVYTSYDKYSNLGILTTNDMVIKIKK